jgi:hypothetical protein
MSVEQLNAVQNNIMATASPNVTAERLADFSKIRTYKSQQQNREGLLQVAPISLYAKIGFGFSDMKQNKNGHYYFLVEVPGQEDPAFVYLSKGLQVDKRLTVGLTVQEFATFAVLSRNESIDKETGEVEEYLRFERKSTGGINREATKALAELGY